MLCEAEILAKVDHPFLASLWGTISTPTHLHFLMEPCTGGELYAVLNSQPGKRFSEEAMRFYAAEVRGSPPLMASAASPDDVAWVARAGCLRTGAFRMSAVPAEAVLLLLLLLLW